MATSGATANTKGQQKRKYTHDQAVEVSSANLPNTCSSVVMLPNPTLFTAEQV